MWFCFYSHAIKKMQTTQYRKPRIWEMREDKYTKSLAKNQVCERISYARYSEQRFTQIYKALYLETTRCPSEKHKIWPPEPTDRNICCWVFLQMRELMKIKVNYLFWDKECLDSKISKNRNVFKPHNRFRDGHLNAASRNSLEIPSPSMAKRRTLSNRNFYKLRCLAAVLTHESRIAEELVVFF